MRLFPVFALALLVGCGAGTATISDGLGDDDPSDNTPGDDNPGDDNPGDDNPGDDRDDISPYTGSWGGWVDLVARSNFPIVESCRASLAFEVEEDGSLAAEGPCWGQRASQPLELVGHVDAQGELTGTLWMETEAGPIELEVAGGMERGAMLGSFDDIVTFRTGGRGGLTVQINGTLEAWQN